MFYGSLADRVSNFTFPFELFGLVKNERKAVIPSFCFVLFTRLVRLFGGMSKTWTSRRCFNLRSRRWSGNDGRYRDRLQW